MAIIGTFTASGHNFTGKINTLNLDVFIGIVAIEAPSENGPAFRLMTGDVEVGAGWKRTGRDSGREYCFYHRWDRLPDRGSERQSGALRRAK
jgi:uncharacterized protein (DUF736 family)